MDMLRGPVTTGNQPRQHY